MLPGSAYSILFSWILEEVLSPRSVTPEIYILCSFCTITERSGHMLFMRGDLVLLGINSDAWEYNKAFERITVKHCTTEHTMESFLMNIAIHLFSKTLSGSGILTSDV